ncbi:MAG: hypothetical protein H7Y20_08915 [Bryobacteraceae bacterium]|nr:hypothetical protein [Bryobacteraceae bacterium]
MRTVSAGASFLVSMFASNVIALAQPPAPPLDLVVIVDELRGAPLGWPVARSLPRELSLRPQDRIALIELKREPKLKAALDANPKRVSVESPLRIAPPLQRKQIGSGGRIHDAIVLGCMLFEKPRDPSRIRSLLLISEDRERGSKADSDRAMSALKSSKASLFLLRDSLNLPKPEWQLPYPAVYRSISFPKTVSVAPLVTQTGGRIEMSDQSSFSRIVETILELNAASSVAGKQP